MVQGCETVQTSKYSVILGVPVALAGAVFFGLLFYLAVGLLRSSATTLVRVFKVLAFLGALAIIPLFLLQAIVLKAFCTYCLATEVLMLAIWVLSFLLAAPGRSGEPLEAGAAAQMRLAARHDAAASGDAPSLPLDVNTNKVRRRGGGPSGPPPLRRSFSDSGASLLDGQHPAVAAGRARRTSRSSRRSP